jgi:uncharacterized protein YndB with AHSA1/START domain
MIDVQHQVSSVGRKVADRTLEAGEARVVTIGQTYDATVDELWDACTNGDRIPRWLTPISGELRLGGRYQLEGNAGGTITECEPPHHFAATWEFDGNVSWIEVRVSDEGDGRARVELDHIALIEAHWDEFGPGAVGIGWDLAVMGLALHLTGDGAAPDHAAVEEWSVSDDGRRFMTEVGEAWCTADIAGGSDPDDARRRAAATIAAYTGG